MNCVFSVVRYADVCLRVAVVQRFSGLDSICKSGDIGNW